MRVRISTCKIWLASLWFLGSGTIAVLLVLQSFGGAYDPLAQDVWEWFLPNVVPTLSLIAAILAADARGKAFRGEMVDRFFFRLTSGLSLFYLLLIILSILVIPRRVSTPAEKVDFLRMSSLWLAPLQGLVAASLGVFFMKESQRVDGKQAAGVKPAVPPAGPLPAGPLAP